MNNVDMKTDEAVTTVPKTLPRPTSSETAALQNDLDSALLTLSRTKIADRRPRSNSGQIEVFKQGSIILARSCDTLTCLMEQLATENILGMGVVDETRDNRVIGQIDIVNICDFLFNHCLPKFNKDAPVTGANIAAVLTESNCTELQACLDKRTVLDVMKWLDSTHKCQFTSTFDTTMIHSSPFCSSMIIPEGHSLLFAMQLLLHPGVKRLISVDSNQTCTGYYSASMALSDIRQSAHLLRPFTQIPVSRIIGCEGRMDDLTCCPPSAVAALPITATAFEAFEMMLQRNITGIALLDGAGKLTGTLSIRDLRGCGKRFENLSRLALSIKDFKSITLKEFPMITVASHWSHSSQVPHGCRYIDLEQGKMSDCILALNDGNLARVFILDRNGNLRGIITLCDIIRCLLEAVGCFEIQPSQDQVDQSTNVSDTDNME